MRKMAPLEVTKRTLSIPDLPLWSNLGHDHAAGTVNKECDDFGINNDDATLAIGGTKKR